MIINVYYDLKTFALFNRRLLLSQSLELTKKIMKSYMDDPLSPLKIYKESILELVKKTIKREDRFSFSSHIRCSKSSGSQPFMAQAPVNVLKVFCTAKYLAFYTYSFSIDKYQM